MQALRRCALAFVLALLAGCASGPKFNTVESSLSAVPAGKARIFFYRATTVGGAIQPEVKLNGEVVGSAKPHGVFFVDRNPGNMEVVTGSEIERKLTFTVRAGERRYVKLGVGLGVVVFRIIPELVSESEARKEMADLAFIGPAGQ